MDLRLGLTTDGIFITIIVFVMSLIFGPLVRVLVQVELAHMATPDAVAKGWNVEVLAGTFLLGIVIGTFGYVLTEAITGASLER